MQDPLYVLKLKCCYLEELLEERYNVDQSDLLKEIAELKSQLKSNGLLELKKELQEIIPIQDNDVEWMNLLKESLLVPNKKQEDSKSDKSNSVESELEHAKQYIVELEKVQEEFLNEKQEYENLFAENQELHSRINELENNQSPPSPLLNRGDTSLLKDYSILKSPVVKEPETINSISILKALIKVLNNNEPPEIFNIYKDNTEIYPLLQAISESLTIRIDDAKKEAIHDSQIKLKQLKDGAQQDASEFAKLQEKVNGWKVQVMQAMNEKEETIQQLSNTINVLKQELSIKEPLIVHESSESIEDTDHIEALEKLKQNGQFLQQENERLKRANEKTNQRFQQLVSNAEKLKQDMDRYEQESRRLINQLKVVESEKEALMYTFELLKEKLELKLGEAVNDGNLVDKYELMISETERLAEDLKDKNYQLNATIEELEKELDIAVGQTEAERIKSEKMQELLEEKEKISQLNSANIKELQRLKQLQIAQLTKLANQKNVFQNDYRVRYEDVTLKYKQLNEDYQKLREKYKRAMGRSTSRKDLNVDAISPQYENVMLQEALKDLEKIRQ